LAKERKVAKNLSTFAIAKILHVDPGSVANWIDQGLLTAHRTPGGHRRVAPDNLVAFLKGHQMPVPDELAPDAPRVLIVDDEPAIATLVSQSIRTAYPHYDVHTASDGFQAGTILATVKPQLVILDLRMPGMDGFEVCKLIKSQPATKNTEVIAMTAYRSPENEKRILDAGARTCLSKPLDIEKLLSEISAAV
jgi:CheY-like chemotaxis protein